MDVTLFASQCFMHEVNVKPKVAFADRLKKFTFILEPCNELSAHIMTRILIVEFTFHYYRRHSHLYVNKHKSIYFSHLPHILN